MDPEKIKVNVVKVNVSYNDQPIVVIASLSLRKYSILHRK